MVMGIAYDRSRITTDENIMALNALVIVNIMDMQMCASIPRRTPKKINLKIITTVVCQNSRSVQGQYPIGDGSEQTNAMPEDHHPWFISYVSDRAMETNLKKKKKKVKSFDYLLVIIMLVVANMRQTTSSISRQIAPAVFFITDENL